MTEKVIWRYATIVGRNEVEVLDQLNRAGYEGWELVSMNCLTGIEGARWIGFVKLPIQAFPLLGSSSTSAGGAVFSTGSGMVAGMVGGATVAPTVSTPPQQTPPQSVPTTPSTPSVESFLDSGDEAMETATNVDALATEESTQEPMAMEISGDDFDFGLSVPTTTESSEELPKSPENVDAAGPEFDTGATPNNEEELFHLAPEQQAILTGGSVMSLDDFPAEFSDTEESAEEIQAEREKAEKKDSGTMMSLDDFPKDFGQPRAE